MAIHRDNVEDRKRRLTNRIGPINGGGGGGG